MGGGGRGPVAAGLWRRLRHVLKGKEVRTRGMGRRALSSHLLVLTTKLLLLSFKSWTHRGARSQGHRLLSTTRGPNSSAQATRDTFSAPTLSALGPTRQPPLSPNFLQPSQVCCGNPTDNHHTSTFPASIALPHHTSVSGGRWEELSTWF